MIPISKAEEKLSRKVFANKINYLDSCIFDRSVQIKIFKYLHYNNILHLLDKYGVIRKISNRGGLRENIKHDKKRVR